MASGENCFNGLFAERYRPGYRLALALCAEPALAASTLGVSTGTVKRQLWRGLARLHTLLAGEARS